MPKQFITDLISAMTLDEKLAQMTQLAPLFFGTEEQVDLTGPMTMLNVKSEWIKNVGSTLNGFGADKLIAMQDKNLRENPHKIPLLFMADVIYGYKTVFPIPLAMGCSFNPEVCEIAASVAAKECSASGIALTFAPMADLVRDPRWGRVMESPGEDPYLNSLMVAATVRGFQGENIKDPGKIAACVKHFAGYGASEAGRDYNTVDISGGLLRDFYLPAYKAAVDAGVAMVMTSFNTVDRIPASANKKLFRDLLRDEWGFDGVVISDYNAVSETILHQVAADGTEAAKLCIEAGVDIEMMSTHYLNCAEQLAADGKLSVALIDEAVTRILELKDALGLFSNPYKDANADNEKKFHRCAEHLNAACEVAKQSIVLLKNGGVLPLKKGVKVGLAGPFIGTANTAGGWSLQGSDGTVSLYEALCEKLGASSIVTAMSDELGSMQNGIFDVVDHVDSACEVLKECDVIIVGVGENPSDTGEAASKTNIRLSPNQEKLIHRLKEIGKPVVTVIFSGRPLEIKPILCSSDAVLQAWFLGTQSGNAIAAVLVGDYNPSARLSMSFPQTVGQIPIYYNCYNTGRPNTGQADRYVSKYLDCPNEPLFCFGYGLSYSTFDYSNMAVTQGETIKASVTVKNTSAVAGKETVQLYISDVVASLVRPLRELKGIKQIELAPNSEQVVTFEIDKDMMKFWTNEAEYVFEEGEFDIMIGRNSSDLLVYRIKI